MRKGVTILFLLFAIGCESDRVVFKGPYFVRFTDESSFAKESHSQPISIQVHNGGPALDEDIVIGYKLSGNARLGVDYSIVGGEGTVTIPKGEYKADIQLQLINNSNNILGSQDVIFTLLSVNSNKLQVGQGESFIGTKYTFTIFDDCILGGDYIGHKGNTSVPDITITSTDCENYSLSNFNIGIDPDIYPFGDALNLAFVDNGDNTLTIPTQQQQNLDTDKKTISGTGTVDPATRIITMIVVFEDYDGQPTHQFTLLPN